MKKNLAVIIGAFAALCMPALAADNAAPAGEKSVLFVSSMGPEFPANMGLCVTQLRVTGDRVLHDVQMNFKPVFGPDAVDPQTGEAIDPKLTGTGVIEVIEDMPNNVAVMNVDLPCGVTELRILDATAAAEKAGGARMPLDIEIDTTPAAVLSMGK